jgi:hypothetical protein
MARKRNPVGIAAGKLILAMQKECAKAISDDDAVAGEKVLYRAHTLLQASQSSSVISLLDGRTVVEYLDADWVRAHPSVEPCIYAFVEALNAGEGS